MNKCRKVQILCKEDKYDENAGMSNSESLPDVVIELRDDIGAKTIAHCAWRIRTFVERDTYAEYDYDAGLRRSPCDVVREFHIEAINSVMRARSSRKAWQGIVGLPLPELDRIGPELDLIDVNDSECRAANDALAEIVARFTAIAGLTEMGVSKVLHLLRPRFVAIADSYVRDCLGISRSNPADTLLRVQGAIRDLGQSNREALTVLQEFAASLSPATPQRGRFAGHPIPVVLSRVRILDILLWTENAIHGPTPHADWSRWHSSEILGRTTAKTELVRRPQVTA